MRYRTIVADPPWPYPEGFVTQPRTPGKWSGQVQQQPLPYPAMSVDDICRLPVKSLAQNDVAGNRSDKSVPRDGATLLLWTTTKWLRGAYRVAEAWGFTPTTILVWCKPQDAVAGGTFAANVEFIIVGRHGSPRPAQASLPSRWFTWPRGRHSQKPEAFFDLVEQVFVGPYLELFARRQRLGWDTWGNEALNHIDMQEVAP